jgi:hypothetical protein
VQSGREIATIATKAGTDATAILQRRASEGLDELRALAGQTAPR